MEQTPRRSLVPLMAAVGAAALVGQTILVRELMVSFYGTELALAAALSCWLAFIPLGAVAGAIALKAVRRRSSLVCLGPGLLALALPAGFLLARMVRPILGAQTGEFLGLSQMLLGAALAASPMGFAVGFFFPVASSFEEARAGRRGTGIGRIYIAEAVGSGVAGGLLSLYLLGHQTPFALALGMSAVLLLASALWAGGLGGAALCAACGASVLLFCLSAAAGRPLLFFGVLGLAAVAGLVPSARRRSLPWAVFLVLLVCVCAAAVGFGDDLARATTLARWRTVSTWRRLAGTDTRYQHLELGEREGSYMLVQNGVRTGQFPEPQASQSRAALLLTQHPQPRDVLVIGGGLGGLCQQLLQSPLRSVDYVEPDPGLIRLVYGHLPVDLRQPLLDPRFAAYKCDGRYFVQRCARSPAALAGAYVSLAEEGVDQARARRPAGAYDVVVINVGDPASASASRFYSVEFFRELLDVLRPGGVAAVCGITGDENYVGSGPVLDYTACVYGTLRQVFPWIVVRPGSEFCYFAAAQAGVASSVPQVLVGRFDRMQLRPRGLRYAFELEQFPPERVRWVMDLLERALPTAALNGDARPVVFPLFLRVQAGYARAARGAPGADLFTRVRSLHPLWFCAPFVAALLAVLLLRLVAGLRAAAPGVCGLTIFTTGIFGMAGQMLIVYGYQTSFGYVYRDISVLVGLFMVGVALGAWLMNRLALTRPRRPLLAVEAAQAVLILSLPVAARLLSFSPCAFMMLSPAVGFLTGAAFPLAAAISLGSGRRAGTVAGAFDAADHLGALVGAAWAGLLLVPLLGVVQGAAVLSLVKCTSLGALVAALAGWRAGGPAGRPAQP